jgi:ABC-type transport system involved in multi-copper enzyme maturation permease subunit
MRQVSAVAAATFRGVLGHRVMVLALLVVLLMGLQMLLMFLFSEEVSSGGRGLLYYAFQTVNGYLEFGAFLLALVFGATFVSREISQKTIQAVLVKPMAPWKFLTGKFLGGTLFLAALYGLTATLLFGMFWIARGWPDWRLLPLMALALLGHCVTMALVMALAQTMPPMAAGGLVFLMYWASGISELILEAGSGWNETAQFLLSLPFYLVARVMPAQEFFVMSDYLEYGYVHWPRFGTALLYAILCAACFAGAALRRFSRARRYASA